VLPQTVIGVVILSLSGWVGTRQEKSRPLTFARA